MSGAPRAAEVRDVDATRAELRGEGATLRVEVPEHAYPTLRDVERRAPGHAEAGGPTYHDEPVIKEPVWIWSIPLYFFVGGLAGGSAALAAAAHALDAEGQRPLVRRAHAISAIGDVLSAGLLVHDLGRPARFLNMLRVLRPTSP